MTPIEAQEHVLVAQLLLPAEDVRRRSQAYSDTVTRLRQQLDGRLAAERRQRVGVETISVVYARLADVHFTSDGQLAALYQACRPAEASTAIVIMKWPLIPAQRSADST